VFLAVATWAEAWPLRNFRPRVVGMGRRPVSLTGWDALLSAGFAGACRPELSPGDVLVTSSTLVPVLGAVEGEIITVTSVASPPQKAAFGRDGAAAVDMETAWHRDRAEHAGVPFLGVRVIVDRLDDRALGLHTAWHYPAAARSLRTAVEAALKCWPGSIPSPSGRGKG
jgi:nucleoside phosphorylase